MREVQRGAAVQSHAGVRDPVKDLLPAAGADCGCLPVKGGRDE
jgi:hypothetical protein